MERQKTGEKEMKQIMKKTLFIVILSLSVLSGCGGGSGGGGEAVPVLDTPAGESQLYMKINPDVITATRVGNDWEWEYTVLLENHSDGLVELTDMEMELVDQEGNLVFSEKDSNFNRSLDSGLGIEIRVSYRDSVRPESGFVTYGVMINGEAWVSAHAEMDFTTKE